MGRLGREARIGYEPIPHGAVHVERNVVIQRPDVIVAPAGAPGRTTSIGIHAPFFHFFFGPPPPPPVVVAPMPTPVYIERIVPPPVVIEREVIVGPAPFDPYADALGRLASRHDNSRRDGALTLGHLADPRAVPALVHLLRTDDDDEVRSAAAQALGAIGDPRAAPALEEAALGDDDDDVRWAASHAFARLPTLIASPPVDPSAAGVANPAAPLPDVVPPPPRSFPDGVPSLVPPDESPRPTGFQPLRPRGG
jgi:hypothetical protein